MRVCVDVNSDFFQNQNQNQSQSIDCVCVSVCVCVCLCVSVCVLFYIILFIFLLNLHVKALLKALVYIISWFDYNVIDVVNVVMFYLVIISEASNEFLHGDDKNLLN